MNFNLNTSIEILERTPKVMKALLWALSDEWVKANEGENTWNAFDIIGHLIHCENTDWIPRMDLILSKKEDKTFAPFDRFAQFHNSKRKTMHDLLEEFDALRAKNITYLKSLNLTENEFVMTGNHPALGEVTLKQLLATWTTHDFTHLAQISRVMAKHYTQDVGPWHEFINVLKDRT